MDRNAELDRVMTSERTCIFHILQTIRVHSIDSLFGVGAYCKEQCLPSCDALSQRFVEKELLSLLGAHH